MEDEEEKNEAEKYWKIRKKEEQVKELAEEEEGEELPSQYFSSETAESFALTPDEFPEQQLNLGFCWKP